MTYCKFSVPHDLNFSLNWFLLFDEQHKKKSNAILQQEKPLYNIFSVVSVYYFFFIFTCSKILVIQKRLMFKLIFNKTDNRRMSFFYLLFHIKQHLFLIFNTLLCYFLVFFIAKQIRNFQSIDANAKLTQYFVNLQIVS